MSGRQPAVTDLRLLAHALRSIAEGVCVTGDDDVIRFVNDAFCAIYGYSRAELVGADIAVLRPDDFPADTGRQIRESTLAGGFSGVIPNVRKDGGRILVSLTTSTVRDEAGAPLALIGVVRDVTEQVRIDEERRTTMAELEAANETLRLLLEGTPHYFFYTCDLEGNITYVSPSVAVITGRPVEEWLGQHHWWATDNPINDEARAATRRHLGGEISADAIHCEIAHADGRPILLEVFESALRREGELVGVQGVAYDVTARERAAESERRRLAQLGAVNRVARAVASRLDTEELLRTAVREIHGAFGYHNVILLRLDPVSRELSGQVVAGAYEHLAPADYRQKVGVGLTGAAAASGETVLANDVSRDPRYIVGFPEEVATRAELCVPIAVDGEVVAVLNVQETRVDAFDDSDVATLETVADQLAVALANARLFERLQQELDERRRADAALRASEERYRHLVESASDLIFEVDGRGRLTYCNEVATRVFGVRPDEVVGRHYLEFIPSEWRKEARLRLRQQLVARSGSTYVELPVRTAEGDELWLGHRVQLITEGKKIVAFRAVSRDVTERRIAEAALRAERDRARQVLDVAAVLFVAIDRDGRVTLVNRRAAELLGLGEAEIVGRDWFSEFIPAAARDELRATFDKLISGHLEGLEYCENPLLAAGGRERMIAWRNTLLRDADGEIVGTLSSGEDVTERRDLEERLRNAQKIEAMGRLAGGVAHDFNNLLQAMLATVQLLRLGSDRAAVEEAIAELEGHVRRGSALARQLLLFARRGITKPERLDLNEVVREAAGMLRRLVRENVQMTVSLAPEPLPIEGDVGQLEQVLANLVVNAVDAMPDGGRLALRTGANDGRPWLEVEDGGCGMGPEVRERLFEPFFTTKGETGTGLGLAVVHGIVGEHGGEVTVSSEEGVGSRFRVTLPQAAAGVFGGARERSGDQVPAVGGGERVLLVEDNQHIRAVMAKMFERLGYRVTVVDSGEAAGALPAEPAYDLLLTDVMLPGASGVDVARGLGERWPRLRVILMSGYAEDEVLREDVAAGHVRFLQKPVDLATLAREVRAALDE